MTPYTIINRAWKRGFPTWERWGIFSGEQVQELETASKIVLKRSPPIFAN